MGPVEQSATVAGLPRPVRLVVLVGVLLVGALVVVGFEPGTAGQPRPEGAGSVARGQAPGDHLGAHRFPTPAGAGVTRQRCRGVTIRPDQDPRRVMRLHPPRTTFCLARGTHRLARPLVPQRGDAVVGRRGAVLNGSKVLTGWSADDQGWTASAHLPRSPSDVGECLPTSPACTRTEDVFLDGRPLARARSRDGVTPGSFFADYSSNEVTLGVDPRGRLVEQAVAPSLVRSAASGVTVRNLVVEKAANEAQEAAIDGRTSSPRTGARWSVENNVVQLNHGVGIGIGRRGVVRDNVVRRQGQLGVSVWEQHVLVRDNVVLENGTAGYDPDWESGGLKAWVTEDVRLVRNQVHGNLGPGLWIDGGCLDTTYRGNEITRNWGAGIQHEISYDALVVRNRVVGNGLRHKGWAWEAGIQIQSSGGLGLIVVRRNTVAGNPHGIMVLESGRRLTEHPAPHGPHVVRNVRVVDNTVTLRPGQWTGVVQDLGSRAVFGREIRFRDNTYRLLSATQRSFAWRDALIGWGAWRTSAGQDRDGRRVVLE